MTGFMAFMFYSGGFMAACRSLRAEGCGHWSTALNAICWPFVLGVAAARWADRNNPAPEE